MKSGTVGKTGFLRLGFEHRGSRTILANLERRAPYMAQRALYCDQEMPDLACVFLITTTGCLLQGDRLALDITLGPARAGARHHAVGDQDPRDGRQLRGANADHHACRRCLSGVSSRSRHPASARAVRQRHANLHRSDRRRFSFRRSSSLAESIIIRTNASAQP